MQENNFKALNYKLTGFMTPVDNPCLWCGRQIPDERRAGSKYCTDSHKQMAYKQRHQQELESAFEEIKDEPEVQANDTPSQVVAETKTEAQQYPQKDSVLPRLNEPIPNLQRYEQNMLCKATGQLEDLVVNYNMYGRSGIPKNDVHAILPTKYRLDTIQEIKLSKCILRLDVNKKEYLICKNKSL